MPKQVLPKRGGRTISDNIMSNCRACLVAWRVLRVIIQETCFLGMSQATKQGLRELGLRWDIA